MAVARRLRGTETARAIDQLPLSGNAQLLITVQQLTIHRKWLPQLVKQLVPEGWEVVAHGKQMRSADAFNISVTSGMDWFDLDAQADFSGVTASLPTLLTAITNQQDYIVLDDGSHGMLPDECLRRCARLADMGATDGEFVRYSKTQALLPDVLVGEQENVTVDRDFTKYCETLAAFDGIKPAKEPRGFRGQLRSYQCDGLAWLRFLREFEFGGCLADDMGFGQTLRVLAMLETRRTQRLKQDETRRPSIAVVPKRLIFNWIEEASRFTPKLRVRDYTGLNRREQLEQLGVGDLLITTYGTLLRDIGKLKDVAFDYAILDEAQAIKNTNSQSAKACRLLTARHRLVMTGTPVENHLGDLWSLFDFLNPGMLGNSSAFRKWHCEMATVENRWRGSDKVCAPSSSAGRRSRC